MMRSARFAAATIILALSLPSAALAAPSAAPHLAPEMDAPPDLSVPYQEALDVGRKIWQNECGQTIAGLTDWDEYFCSMGIGHFIWYPKGVQGPFIESFIPALSFLEQNGATVPDWLKKHPACPWQTRADLDKNFNSPRMQQVRQLLADTVGLQSLFMADRLKKSLPQMLQGLPANEQAHVQEEFIRVWQSPDGLYPLMDYVNFKGEGVALSERYNGQGWGLLQVLEGMTGKKPGPKALSEFSASAKAVLERRVKNSPPKNKEAVYLPNWEHRVASYSSAP